MGKNKIAEALQKINSGQQVMQTPQIDKKYLTEKGEMPTLSQFWTKSNSVNNDFGDAGDTNKMMSQIMPIFSPFLHGEIDFSRITNKANNDPNNILGQRKDQGDIISGISNALDALSDLKTNPEDAIEQAKVLISNPESRGYLFGQNSIFNSNDPVLKRHVEGYKDLIARTIGDLYKKTKQQYNQIYKTNPPNKQKGTLNAPESSQIPGSNFEQQINQTNPKLRVIKNQ